MADGVFNRAKGAAAQLAIDNGSAFEVLLLKANESEAALVDHVNVTDLLAAAGNTEADFTNYARKTGITVTRTQDDGNDRVDLDIPDQTWTEAGGATNNTLTKLVVCVSVGAGDGNLIPLTHHDWPRTTDGSNLTATLDAAGFYRAS